MILIKEEIKMKKSIEVKKSDSMYKGLKTYMKKRSRDNAEIYRDLEDLTEGLFRSNKSMMAQIESIQKNM
jgi:hypothetical protein